MATTKKPFKSPLCPDDLLSPNDIISALANRLPDVFHRNALAELTCGVMCYGTQKNLDSAGQGPKRFRTGKKVFNEKNDYLPWLEAYLRDRWIDAPDEEAHAE